MGGDLRNEWLDGALSAVLARAARRTAAHRFWPAAGGGLSVPFALFSLLLALAAGAAIDMASWLHARTDTMLAVDAAVVAGGKSLQLGAPDPEAVAVAMRHYLRNSEGRLRVESDSIAFAVAEGGSALTAYGTAYIATPFMAIVGIDRLPLMARTGGEFATARLASGTNARASIEIALMLDVSSAMRGDRINAIKDAARDLADIVVWQDQSRYTARLALVPYASDIRLELDLYLAVRDPSMPGPINGEPYPCLDADPAASCTDLYYRRGCLVERTGSDRFTDAGPGPGRYLMPLFTTAAANCRTPAASAVLPLTADRAVISERIAGLAPGGARAAQLGTAWSWYLLSPDWQSVLPPDSAPTPYDVPKTRKIAVLLIGGGSDVTYSQHGMPAWLTGAPSPVAAVNGPADDQALALCAGMKRAGIEIFTVGFGIAGAEEAGGFVAACASDRAHARRARTPAQLRSTFRDIAMHIVTLDIAY